MSRPEVVQMWSTDFDWVRRIQSVLKPEYYAGEVDADYRDATVDAVRRFQTDHGPGPADGSVGPDTWGLLEASYGPSVNLPLTADELAVITAGGATAAVAAAQPVPMTSPAPATPPASTATALQAIHSRLAALEVALRRVGSAVLDVDVGRLRQHRVDEWLTALLPEEALRGLLDPHQLHTHDQLRAVAGAWTDDARTSLVSMFHAVLTGSDPTSIALPGVHVEYLFLGVPTDPTEVAALRDAIAGPSGDLWDGLFALIPEP